MDGSGNGSWITFDTGPFTHLVSRLLNGSDLEECLVFPEQTLGIDTCPNTDLAANVVGDLYLFADSAGGEGSCDLYRIVDFFGASTAAVLVRSFIDFVADVHQIAVDPQNRVLVSTNLNAGGSLLERIIGEGDTQEVELLAQFAFPIRDLETDGDGAVYVSFDDDFKILNPLGEVIEVIRSARVLDQNGSPLTIPFDHLLGFGIDFEGNLRILDDVQIPLGLDDVAARGYTIDIGVDGQ
jgi:hypothetical protein